MTGDDLCFTARALAQTHPLSEDAHRYRQARFDEERARQPIPELADWASTALLVGYCLRRAEEREAGLDLQPAGSPDLGTIDAVSQALRVGDPQSVTLLPAATILDAIDRLIATELDKRSEHLREQLSDDDWHELEDYITWWVVHGYGLRATECANPPGLGNPKGCLNP